MKPLKIEQEGPFVDERGYLHIDTGDPWHAEGPRLFWTAEARRLFKAALDGGFLQTGEGGAFYNFRKGEGVTWSMLAYWCQRASSYLGLDRNSTTYWKPFEDLLGLKEKTLSRASGRIWLKDGKGYRAEKDPKITGPVDAFFDALDAGPTPTTTTSTSTTKESI